MRRAIPANHTAGIARLSIFPGVLSAADINEIVLGDDELVGYAFIDPDEVAQLVTPLLARRIGACIQAVADGVVAALENGVPVA